MVRLLVVTLLLLLAAAACMATLPETEADEEVTDSNFEQMTKNKVVFLKFYMPWCSHSQAIQKVWGQLEVLYHKNATHLVQSVKCEDEHGRKTIRICNENGIQAYPTLMYGNPEALKLYNGKMDLETLKHFVDNKLKLPCSPLYIEACNEIQKEKIFYAMGLTEEQLRQHVQEEENKIKDVESKFDAKLNELQKKYEETMYEQEVAIEKLKQGDLAIYKTVLRSDKESYEELLKAMMAEKLAKQNL